MTRGNDSAGLEHLPGGPACPETAPKTARSILFVHQGYELYGSDRTLVQSVQATASRWPGARITVLLPRDGELRAVLLRTVEDVRVVDLAILRRSNLKHMSLRSAGGLMRRIREARRMMLAYDLTYINTVTVMDFILAAGLARRARVVHVHEIPTGAAALCFSALLGWSRASLIFNSAATRDSFWVPFWQPCSVVWNGVAAVPEPATRAPHQSLNLLLIGRFNGWKGQAVLLHAIAKLPGPIRSAVKVRMVGGVFADQTHFASELTGLIAGLHLSGVVEILPFCADPASHYRWADVVVVPSTKPEPFGLVAIEGMASGCAVIGANHGGLREIVVGGVTGSLVEPGSVESLATAIALCGECRPGETGRGSWAEAF